MSMRVSVVAVFTCDNARHAAAPSGTSSFGAKTEEQAKANAIAVGWRPRTETPLGVPVQMWDCPRCARAAAAQEAMP